MKTRFNEKDSVAFEIVDPLHGVPARGAHSGPVPGLVRPALRGRTRFVPEPAGSALTAVQEPGG